MTKGVILKNIDPGLADRLYEANLLFIIPDFFWILPMNFAMATLGLKEMGEFLWEGKEKRLPSWLSQFSFAKLW